MFARYTPPKCFKRVIFFANTRSGAPNQRIASNHKYFWNTQYCLEANITREALVVTVESDQKMSSRILPLAVIVASVLFLRGVQRHSYIKDDADDVYDYIIGQF